jgi:hypothetical protein
MTPKKKAIELVDKMGFSTMHTIDNTSGQSTPIYKNQYAKQCALIAVNEMLDYRNALFINEGSLAHQYLLQVKEEINKL